jgi:hypothetical protein
VHDGSHSRGSEGAALASLRQATKRIKATSVGLAKVLHPRGDPDGRADIGDLDAQGRKCLPQIVEYRPCSFEVGDRQDRREGYTEHGLKWSPVKVYAKTMPR